MDKDRGGAILKRSRIAWFVATIRAWRRQASSLKAALEMPDTADFILAKRVELLYRGFLPSALGTAVISLLFVAAMWGRHVPNAWLLIWLGAVWCITAMRGALVYWYRNRHDMTDRQWLLRYAIGTLVAGSAWGATAVLFMSSHNDAANLLVIFFIAGVTAASSVLLSADARSAILFLLPALLPLFTRLMLEGDRAYTIMALAVLAHLAVLYSAARRGQGLIWNAMRSALENERLKGAFAAERMLSEQREQTVTKLLALEDENRLFRQMVEQASDLAIVMHDPADGGRIVYGNDAACRHFGVTRDELLTLRPIDFDPNHDKLDLADIALRLQRSEAVTIETEHHIADGKLIPVEVILLPILHNGRFHCVSYIRDIRARREAESQRIQFEAAMARQQAEQQFRDLVESLPDMVARLDLQARHVYVSPQVLRNLGKEAGEMLGKTAVEAGITGFVEGDRMLLEAALHVAETGETDIRDMWWYQPNGRHALLELRHMPERDATGRVVGVLGVARDMTNRAKMERTLQFIAKRGGRLTGETFLTTLARHLAETLDVAYVIVDRLAENDPETAETVAICAQGEVVPNMRYSLKHTPCENVFNGELCCYPERVQQLFPKDPLLVDMQVESYIGQPLWDSAGRTIGLIAIMDDKPLADAEGAEHLLKLVTARVAAELERERNENALRARELEYQRLLDHAPDLVVRYDTRCRRTYINAAYRKYFGKLPELGKTPAEDWVVATLPEVVVDYQHRLEHTLATGREQEWEMAVQDAEGRRLGFLVRAVPEFDQAGAIVGVFAFARDVTERKQLAAESQAREQEFRALVENSPDFITRYDRQCRRTYVNPSLGKLVGGERTLGTRITELFPELPLAHEYEAVIRQVMETGRDQIFLFRFPGVDGQTYDAEMRVVPEYDAWGKVTGVLAIGRDISERLRMEEEMQRQASYDALTGLPNRHLFNNRLREEVAKAGRSQGNLALLFIDLDHFKEVNDTLGHETGDQLLMEAALRIQGGVRESDLVARLGGDEFVIILSEMPDLTHLGTVAQNLIDVLMQPFNLGEHLAYVSASIGIACYPSDADSAESLVSCADHAMYAAKNQGRNGFSYFTPAMQAQAESRLHLANDLHRVLEEGQLQLYFQPIVEIATGRVAKAEALLRWHHPEKGMIPPNLFIPVAEEIGLIKEIGDWVFRESVKLARQWQATCIAGGERPCFQVSVNISPRQFIRNRIDTSWIEYLAASGLPPEFITLEITEGLLLSAHDEVVEQLARFRQAGMRVALDDFGTGYSAMAYLKKFNIDYLKIDYSFVRDLAEDESDRAIAEAIVVMAHKLGLKTIAEGVERAEQRDILAAVGCDYVQGYLYARPMPAEDFLQYVAQIDLETAE